MSTPFTTFKYIIWISLSVLVLQDICSWEILLLYEGMLMQYYGFCFLCMSSDYDPRLDLALLCLEAVGMCCQLAFLHHGSNVSVNDVNKQICALDV